MLSFVTVVMGANPEYFSCSFMIEEGLELANLSFMSCEMLFVAVCRDLQGYRYQLILSVGN